jgi:hypothetical protein
MTTTLRNLVSSGVLLAVLSSAHALTIVRTNDASMSNTAIISAADAASASAAFDFAAGQIMALYSDPVQINIILAATTDPGVLGESTGQLTGTFTYAQIRNLLINDNNAHPSADGTTSTAALPASDPYSCSTFLVARALAKALGNIPSDTNNDGTFTFGTSFAYTYDPLNRAVPGKIDFIGVAFHEITEVMGRVARLNSTGNCNRPYDVFRFTGAGVQSLAFTDANVYFSVNGGSANLKTFNANGNGGDLGDWASGTNDAFNAFSSSGVQNDLTPVDVRVMDVIGYDLGSTSLSNDQCSGAIALSANVIRTDNTTNATSTGDPGTTAACNPVANISRGVWYKFTPGSNGTVTVSTCGSNYDTVLEVYTGTCAARTAIACNDDNGPICSGTAGPASLTFNGTAGTTYLILAASFGSAGTGGSLQIVASVATSPTPTPTATPCGTTVTFSNPAPITINDSLPASPYPSNITVGGVTNSVTKVTVTITGFNHTFPSDVDMLLVGPGGQKFVLVSDVIGGTDAVGINWTLDDAAAAFIGSTGAAASGTFKPTNYTTCQDVFAAPAPAGLYLTPGGIGTPCGTDTLAAFNGVNPNGTWSLYVVDDLGGDVGSISGGWSVNITTAGAGCATTTLGNISTRLRVETGNNVLIGGFIVTGTQPKKVIVRAIGPSLSSLFTGVLADPVLELHGPGGFSTITNDDWRSTQQAEIIATGIPPTNDLESAIVATLPANNAAYTAIVRGLNNGTGIGVVEAYDLDRAVDSKLANISTRGLVQTGNNVMIGGMIVQGQNSLRVIVRAIGPSLPLAGALGDPTLELHDGNGALIAANDNWRSDQEAEIIATTIPPSNDLESAIVRNLAPGNYTAIVRGVNNTIGVALVEAYNLN